MFVPRGQTFPAHRGAGATSLHFTQGRGKTFSIAGGGGDDVDGEEEEEDVREVNIFVTIAHSIHR